MTAELPSDGSDIVAELRNTLSGAYQSSALGRFGGEWLLNLVGPLLSGEASASNFNETEAKDVLRECFDELQFGKVLVGRNRAYLMHVIVGLLNSDAASKASEAMGTNTKAAKAKKGYKSAIQGDSVLIFVATKIGEGVSDSRAIKCAAKKFHIDEKTALRKYLEAQKQFGLDRPICRQYERASPEPSVPPLVPRPPPKVVENQAMIDDYNARFLAFVSQGSPKQK